MSFSVAAHTRLLVGQTVEQLYQIQDDGQLIKRSELVWPLRPAVCLGARLEVSLALGLGLVVDYSSGLNTRSGIITDTDWLNEGGLTITHYSQHDTFVERITLADAELGWSVPIAPAFGLRPFFLFRFLDLAWTAHDGYLQYPPEYDDPFTPWSPSTPKIEVHGTGLTYTQRYLIPALGLETTWSPDPRLSATVGLALSPLTHVEAIDWHPVKRQVYYDSVRYSLFLEPRLRVTATPFPGLGISLDLSYLGVVGTGRGTTVTLETAGGSIDPGGIDKYFRTDATISTFSAVLALRLSL